ncbi:MAG TPA: response regulator [Dissulfurispiraceae bacterium]|nr:response regulator [Dissulfurispiraceae bacterium]
MGKTDRSELLEYFLAEAEDYLNILSRGIPQLSTATNRSALLEELFRAAHTLKGAAAIVKLTVTSQLAHSMEDILETFKNRRLKVDKDVVELLISMLDAIAAIVRDISAGKRETEGVDKKFSDRVAEVLARASGPAISDEELEAEVERAEEALTSSETIVPDLEPAVHIAAFEQPAPSSASIAGIVSDRKDIIKPVEKIEDLPGRRKDDVEYFFGNFVRIDLRKIEDMFNLISEVTIMKNAMMKKTKGAGEISEAVLFAGRKLLEEVNSFSERHAFTITENVKYADPLFSEFGELQFDRYDEQNLFSRKLQEMTEDITEALKELMQFYGDFQEDIKSLDKTVRFLRSDLSESRMIDIGRLFQRFVRPIKELAKEYDKRIDFQISGQSTKIDRVIFENLFDPLMHMIRNCVSHGIERGDERIKCGKRKDGMISLSARREGINIIIEIKDDGAGIDADKVLEAAINQGLVKSDAKLSREEILALIFLPGFSTAGGTDMTSGRGVGMNAVRRQIANINGTLEMSTEVGKGTTFRIKVPSSLAVNNVIVFAYGEIEFVMPTSLVEEVVQYEPVETQSDDSVETVTMVNYRGTPIQAKRLSDIFYISGNGHADKKDNFVIVCSISNRKVGLVVDNVLFQEEAIIKPVNRFLEGLTIYSGVTISGEGKVRLVLNPLKVFEEETRTFMITPPEVDNFEGRRVLVVDDSLSVRKYLSSFLTARNLRVLAAANGSEALKTLEENEVDLIITDLEMPIMHGYELVSRLKASSRWSGIPVIVLTSRSTEKHKEKALELGADEYLVKPFDENNLMSCLRKFSLLPA